MFKSTASLFLLLTLTYAGRAQAPEDDPSQTAELLLRIIHDEEAATISVVADEGTAPAQAPGREPVSGEPAPSDAPPTTDGAPEDGRRPLVVQHARADDRPYIHPISAPDGNGVLTQYRPEHHPHQTGLYWGLKEVNGRDFFMGWRSEHYRRVSASVVDSHGAVVRWETVYDLLGDDGEAVLTETQEWSVRHRGGRILLDLVWTGEAKTDVTLEQFYVGGLFLRMPWHTGIRGDVVNAAGQRNDEAEGQRAIWTDVGVEIEGRSDPGHVAIFDHPDNEAFPVPWRVDRELGVGPSRQILGDWSLASGESTTIRYRLIVYTGDRDAADLTRMWIQFAAGE